MMNSTPHFVLTAKVSWSHLRALCILAAKIICTRSVTVTIIVTNKPGIVERVDREVKRILQLGSENPGVVRIVAIGPNDVAPNSEAEQQALHVVWKQLMAGESVRCAGTDIQHPPAPPPALFVLDGLQRPLLQVVKSIQPCPPTLHFMDSFSGGFLRIAGPRDMGGRGDYLRQLSPGQIYPSRASECTGQIINLRGMPTMYDWEYVPHALGQQDQGILGAEIMLAKMIDEVDGYLSNSTVDIDGPEVLDAITEWVARKQNRPSFHIGLTLPFIRGTTIYPSETLESELEAVPNGNGPKTIAFLDAMLDQFGENSTIYISFGTEHWPESMDHLRVLLFALRDRKIPFVFAYAHPKAVIPEYISAGLKDVKTVFLASFVPQQAVLAHKATGWFVTHAGGNGMVEAASQGVPTIGWPFAIDQPVNVAHCVHQIDTSFDFIEVRTGELGLKPIYLTGKTPQGTAEAFQKEVEETLDALQGEVGQRKRQNALKIKKELETVWTDEGKSTKELERFIDYYST